MKKTSAVGAAARKTMPSTGSAFSVRSKTVVRRGAKSADAAVNNARFDAIMQAARQSGLLGEKDGRIAGRVSEALVKQAKRLTGIQTDTDLIEFALASVALEDHFAEAFKEARGKVDPDLPLGF